MMSGFLVVIYFSILVLFFLKRGCLCWSFGQPKSRVLGTLVGFVFFVFFVAKECDP